MKTILLASDSFKGTLSSVEIASIAKKEAAAFPDDFVLAFLPVADGGEGTCEAFAKCKKGTWNEVETYDANLHPIKASYFVYEHTSVIETASVVGLPHTKIKDPKTTSTFGLGLMLLDAVKKGTNTILLGLGGSSTNDAGLGLAAALGAKFFDKEGKSIEARCPLDMPSIAKADFSKIDNLLSGIKIVAMCDVDNPLSGPAGASAVFGPQKGASKEDVAFLDENLANYAKIICKNGVDFSNAPGAGAAGGLGFCALSILHGSLRSGIETLLETFEFDAMLKRTDIVVSGEGKLDEQSFHGKVIDGIAKKAKAANKPLFLIVGQKDKKISPEFLEEKGISKVFVTNKGRKTMEDIALHAPEDYASAFHEFLLSLQIK